MSLTAGIAVLCAELLLVASLTSHRSGARAAFVLAAILLPLSAFVGASPLSRGLLACFAAAIFIRAADLMFAPPIDSFRVRLAHICAYFDIGKLQRRTPKIDLRALVHLVVATAVLAAAIATVKAVGAYDSWRPLRWFGGAIGILAVAEMVSACQNLAAARFGLFIPPPFDAPYRSTSIAQFWAKRWNVPASAVLRKYCYAPFARRSVAVAIVVTFAVSALGHAGLADIAIGRAAAISCAAFFLIQPMLIAIERQMAVRRWPPAAAFAWTLIALGSISPLVIEPLLQIVEKGWGAPQNVMGPTAAALVFCIMLSAINVVAGLMARPTVAAA
jgi:hypothetical protein